MEYAAFHVVYADKRISADLDGTHLQQVTPGALAGTDSSLQANQRPDCFQEISSEIAVVQDNLHPLLTSFHGGMSRTA